MNTPRLDMAKTLAALPPRMLHADTKPGDFVIITSRKAQDRLATVRDVDGAFIVTEDGHEWIRVNGYMRGGSIWSDARAMPCTLEQARELRSECAKRQQARYLGSIDWTRLPLATLESLSNQVAETIAKEGH